MGIPSACMPLVCSKLRHTHVPLLYPFLYRDTSGDQRIIAIDPSISFGRPVILRKGISTAVLADRVDAGERIENLAEDYDLEPGEIEMAIVYERAA